MKFDKLGQEEHVEEDEGRGWAEEENEDQSEDEVT